MRCIAFWALTCLTLAKAKNPYAARALPTSSATTILTGRNILRVHAILTNGSVSIDPCSTEVANKVSGSARYS